MHENTLAHSGLWAMLVVLLFSCRHDSPPSGNDQTDTRVLVREALNRVDPTNFLLPFNSKRAEILRRKLEQEKSPINQINISMEYAVELLRAGEAEKSLRVLSDLTKMIKTNQLSLPSSAKKLLYSYVAIAFMRLGETQNCVEHHNHQSCFIPIKGEGVHTLPYGSENAIKEYELSLKEFPDDPEARYLLNLAYMTLGKYPGEVPKEYLMNPEWFSSSQKMQPFPDIAPNLGVNTRGHSGGAVMDDFNNDGWLDIAVTDWGISDGMTLYINDGTGHFTEETSNYGLDGQVACLSLKQTDFNNDGYIDLYLMRGAWYEASGDIPNTLLMNTGHGKFEDVTIKAGLTHVAATQACAWADYNLDGWLDLVVANESFEGYARGIDLYINQQNGTFSYEPEGWGLDMNKYFKGCTAVDVNNDRYPDLYLSGIGDGNFLLINTDAGNGHRRFVLSPYNEEVNLPKLSFPCWAFDYDNDGWEDLFVSGYNNAETPVTFWVESKLGKANPAYLPKLYHNTQDGHFREVGFDMGLTEVTFTMGCNFGDINTDGFPDFYLGTGNPAYQSLVPNKMYLNMDGHSFADVSYSGGFANIQKGHGVAFGDFDHDGDQDIYTVIGGAFEGDAFYNSLFQNPNEHHNNWIILDLEGHKSNRKAIGARVKIIAVEEGKERAIYQTVTSGASFGGNSLILEVGLRKATSIKNVNVTWPCRDCPEDSYTGLDINKAYKLKEGSATPVPMEYQAAEMNDRNMNPHAGHEGHEHHTTH